MNTQFFGHLVALAAVVGCAGCASLQSVSVTNIPSERARPISATASNAAFLGIHFDNDFADGVPEELRRQCPHGKVTGVYAKYETTWYVVVENRSVTAKAYCVPGDVATQANTVPLPPPAASATRVDRPPALAKHADTSGAESKGGSS